MKNPVLLTTAEVIKNAQEVKIVKKRLQELAQKEFHHDLKVPSWHTKYHFHSKDKERMLLYLFLLDSLNFCFWSQKKKWYIREGGKVYSGYFALSLALKRFFENYPEKASLKYFSRMPLGDFSDIFRGGGELLLFRERYRILQQVSRFLLEKYNGNLQGFVLSAKHRFSNLVPQIAQIPSFGDIVFYHGKKVYFWKRAQILAADILGAFDNKGIGYFKDLGYLTCFPDYKLPQILLSLGILSYSSSLKKKIQKRVLIPAGSQEEIEIRSATVWAVEYLRRYLRREGRKIFSFQLDWILWNRAQKTKMVLPHHLTKTIFY